MNEKRHQPVRTCVGCRARDERSALVRIVARDGGLVPDHDGRLGGRGAYLHARGDCMENFARRGGFVRSLRCVVAKPERERFRVQFPEVRV